MRDTLATDAGTGTVVVQNGGTFAPNTWESGSGGNESSNTNYANPIIISGVGVYAGITTNDLRRLGAIVGMNSGSGDNSDSDTLTGGVTLTGNALDHRRLRSR